MAKYRIDSVGALARQMQFTPQEARGEQIAAAEALLHAVDPSKAYPFDFVVFKITGYRPKDAGADLLAGGALQHDLGLLVEHVSDTLDVRTASLSEPVLTIDDVTEKFGVTSKTIQRWRRRGLPARRFVFPDGKRRVGFLLGSVDRFFAGHREQVERGTNFSLVGDDERDQILRRARRLATGCRCCANEIARRVGLRLNRSPLTVLHTVRKYDAEHPDRAIFAHAGEPVSDDERARIVRGFRRGLGIRALARRSCRPRSAVYRVVVEERAARLGRRKVKFIDDPLYHQPDAAAVVDAIVAQEPLAAESRPEDSRVARDVPGHLQALCRTPLLSPARERALFLKLNFHKMQFVQARRKLDPQNARARDLNAMEGHLRRATETKNDIVRSNLRLVVNVARKHLRPNLDLMELVSDGTVTLMRAIDSFDAHRGNKFSTYATLALMKGFARSVPQMQAAQRGAAAAAPELLASIADARTGRVHDDLATRDQVGQLLARLDARERAVLIAHYGLSAHRATGGSGTVEPAPETCDQVAGRLGISKERVRQIERSALAKLRDAARA